MNPSRIPSGASNPISPSPYPRCAPKRSTPAQWRVGRLSCCYLLLAMIVVLRGCAERFPSGFTGEGQGSVELVLENQSGLPVVVDARYITADQDVRTTTRMLTPAGPSSTDTILRTVTQLLIVEARIAEPETGEPPPDTTYPTGFVL